MTTITEKLAPASIGEAGAHYAKVTGTFLKKDAVSLNNRFYPAETVEKVVARAKEQLSQEGGIPLQQLVKHGSMDSDESREIVGRLTNVWMDGDYAHYAADIPNTEAGREMATLLQGGYLNTVSLRAEPNTPVVESGEIDGRTIDIVKDFTLAGIDYTLYPGIRDAARVQSVEVYESVDPGRVHAAGLREDVTPQVSESRQWYEAYLEARGAGTLSAGSIDLIQRDYLPLAEGKAFEKPGKYTTADREKIPAADFAGPHKSFPIVTQADVDDAARLVGHAANPEAVKRKVIAIAKRKGFSLPDAWQNEGGQQRKERVMADGASTTDKKTDQTQEAANTPAPLNEAGMHSHPHTHSGADWMGTYSHEHAHPHTTDELVMHDSKDAHTHGHAVENGHPVGTRTQESVTAATTQPTQTPPAADHSHSDAQRLAIAVESLNKLLSGAKTPIVETKPQVTTAQVREALSVLAQASQSTIREAGASTSAANKVHLQAAHDHIATVLGMECCPGGVEPNNAEGDKDGAESALIRQLRGLLTEAGASKAPASKPADPLAALTEAVTKLTQSQAATQQQLTALAEAVPTAARQAAETVTRENWRPERKTVLTENRELGQTSQSAILKEKLADRSIPIEKRMKMAADALESSTPEIAVLQSLSSALDKMPQA